MARTRATSGRRSSPRRKWVWARYDAIFTLGPDAVSQHNLLDDFETVYGAQLIGCTVSRIRGRIAVHGGVGAVGQDNMRVAALVDDSPGAPTAGTDGPYHRQYDDYMLWEPLCFVDPASGLDVQGRMVDNEAMRKLDELGQQLTLVAAAHPSNVGSLICSIDFSIGIKLP